MKRRGLMLLVAGLTAAVCLTGCSGKSDSVIEADTLTTIEKSEESSARAEEYKENVEENIEEITEVVEKPEDSVSAEQTQVIDKYLCGNYVYRADSEEEKRLFSIDNIDGKYYIEYLGNYDYAAGEIEFSGELTESADGEYSLDATIYAFSGFSFMGEYWGSGEPCRVKWDEKGNASLSKGQPFIDREELGLTASTDEKVHEVEKAAKENDFNSEIIGSYRCRALQDDIEYEVYVQFDGDGSFKAVKKAEGYVPQVYKGVYYEDSSLEGYEGRICCERTAYGAMPFEWIFSFDHEKMCPIIREDYSLANPFTSKEEDFLYVKTEAGACLSDIKPGPSFRSKEIEEKYREFINPQAGED